MRGKYLSLVVFTMLLAVGTLTAYAMQTGQDVLKKIQGTWQFVAMETGGQALPAEQLKNQTITFADEKWTVRDGDKVTQAGTHKFDPSKTPGQVDAVVMEGQDKGNTMLGIYELNADTLKVCFDPQGKARPTSFSAKAEQFSATVERKKK